MMTKGGIRRELRLLEIEGDNFITILNFMPMDINTGQVYFYWMADCMWPELENVIRKATLRLSGKRSYETKTLSKLAKTEESPYFSVKLTYVPDLDNSLRDALDVHFDEDEPISNINIKAEVTFKGDRLKLKEALDRLQGFNESENIRKPKLICPKTPTTKRPLQQLQNQNEGAMSPQRIDLCADNEDSIITTSISLSLPPARVKKDSTDHSSQEEKRKGKDEPKKQPKKEKDSDESKKREKTETEDKKSSKTNILKKKRTKSSKEDKSQTKMTNYFSSPSTSKSTGYLSQEDEDALTLIIQKRNSSYSDEDLFDDAMPSECSPVKKKKKTPEREENSIFDVMPSECSPVEEKVKREKREKRKKKEEPKFIDSYIWDSPLPLTPRASTSKSEWDSQSENDSQTDYSAYVKLAQSSPVKQCTPVRRTCKEEVEEIHKRFPDPDSLEFFKDCEKFKSVLAKGDTGALHSKVVERLFKAHLEYLQAVHNGEIRSLLREEFHQSCDNGSTMQYADGGLLFSFENLNRLTDLVSATFHKNKAAENMNVNYTMKVLIPELIARIVMSAYRLNKDEALKKIKEVSITQSQKLFKF
ncbi:uncharacterized protein LOC132193343 [Neocloeon triangulifer]|uniref:uncharacterized protein LOC132193343 n=1 Tax=Neocloeon triangulifer TaxID=2078957 RepID=UPI00286EE75E|nr:uncharacterized protein LOC132193343 [Neocloeon triangulifer]